MLETIYVTNCGIRLRHDLDFDVDRPFGSGDYLFLHFISPIVVRDEAGLHEIPRDASILYAPRFPQYFCCPEGRIDHSWLHCAGGGMATIIEKYQIPTNKVLPLGPLGILTPFLQTVTHEQLHREPFWEEAIAAKTEEFFLSLGRLIVKKRFSDLTPYQTELQEAIRRARAIVHSDLARRWSVAEMAGLINLSASRFTALYSSFYNVSPMEDLLESRIRQSMFLLRLRPNTVETIAEQCGFSSPEHFSRFFRKRTGLSPRRYRQEAR